MGLDAAEFDRLTGQLIKILAAFALCFPMAWDRERSSRSLGVRTFPLVAVASCAFVLIGQSGLGDDPQAMSRVMQGIVAGVGFLGGGAIVKQGVNVHGTATAAAVWTTAALGAAVAEGEYGIAVALGLIGFATLRWLRPLKQVARGERERAERARGPRDDEEDREQIAD
jgi:putative Mg2+ transporter-C (MgtC) family protein